jgi:hypothetical protein
MARRFAHTLTPKVKLIREKQGEKKASQIYTNHHTHNKVRQCQIQPKSLQEIDTAEGQFGWIDRGIGLVILSVNYLRYEVDKTDNEWKQYAWCECKSHPTE